MYECIDLHSPSEEVEKVVIHLGEQVPEETNVWCQILEFEHKQIRVPHEGPRVVH